MFCARVLLSETAAIYGVPRLDPLHAAPRTVLPRGEGKLAALANGPPYKGWRAFASDLTSR